MDQLTAMGRTITLVHYTYRSVAGDGSGNDWRIACMPGMTEFYHTNYHPNVHRTDDWRAVSCPMCKKTELFISAVNSLEASKRGKK